MNAGRLAAAGALVRERRFQIETAPVHVFLHMRNDHIPLADQYAVARHQLQVLNEGQIVQAGPRHFASFDSTGAKMATGAISPVRPGVHSMERSVVLNSSSSNLNASPSL